MPPGGEALDPALILDDWINRVANLPEEIRFLQDEIADRDRRYADCIKIIEERDARIQKAIKANGSHEVNPREEGYRKVIAENFDKAEKLADEKVMLSQKMQAIMDRHIRQLDMQIKQLYDRNEPGFSDPDELPSLLRNNARASSTLSVRSSGISSSTAVAHNPSSGLHKEHTPVSASSAAAGSTNRENLGSGSGRGSNFAQARQAQAHQGHSSSAPASPAASMILGRQAREGSAGPGPGKRGPRANSSLSNAPTASSGLARHSSLGPGTPKIHHQTATGIQRAGSAGPRATLKGMGAGPGRKAGTPSVSSSLVAAAAGVVSASGPGRKKGNGANGGPSVKTLSRVKRPKNSATSSTADSELSEADSASDSNASSRRGTPARSLSHGGNTAGSGPGAANGNGNGNGSGNGSAGSAGDKEGSSQPQLKRERESMGGMSGLSAVSAATANGSGGGSSGGGSGPVKAGGNGGGSGGVAVTKHAPRGAGGVAPSSDDRMDVDDDEAGDDRKYCLCQNVSFGDMVACDNEDCPYEWFHWSCVGLKSEPNGTWYCPVCTENMNGAGGTLSAAGGHSRAGIAGSDGNGSIPATTRKSK